MVGGGLVVWLGWRCVGVCEEGLWLLGVLGGRGGLMGAHLCENGGRGLG